MDGTGAGGPPQEPEAAAPATLSAPARLRRGPAGCRVVIEENHDLPIARLTFTVLTGAADDPAGREGLASFASELCCRGAGGRSRAEIDEALEALGADLSAGADSDSVTWGLEVLSEHLEPAFAIFSDLVLRPDLDTAAAGEEAARLRREMLASLDELRDDDGHLVRRSFARLLYGPDHPYGRPAGGTAASIARLDPEQARRWLGRAIAGGNLIVGVAGDVDPHRVERLLGRRLGVLRPGAPDRVVFPAAAGAAGSPRLLLVDKPERAQSSLVLGQPGLPRAHPDFLALSVATSAFGGMFSSRLNQEVRVKRGLSYGASAHLGQGRGARSLYLSLAPDVDHTVETVALVLELWRSFVEHGLSDEEVDFAKEHMAAALAFQLATPEDRVDVAVGVEVLELPPDYMARLLPSLQAVTAGEVRAAMQRHLHPRDLAIALVSTARRLLPALQRSALLPRAAISVVPFDAAD